MVRDCSRTILLTENFAETRGLFFRSGDDSRHERSDGNDLHVFHRPGAFRVFRQGVGYDEPVEMRGERFFRSFGKHAMGREGGNGNRAHRTQEIGRFANRSARADEVVHDEDLFSARIAFFYGNDPPVAFANLRADDFLVVGKAFSKALGRAVVRENDGRSFGNPQEAHGGVEFHVHFERIEEKPLGKGVDVEGVERGFPRPSGREVRKDVGEIRRGGDFAFFRYALHGSYREERNDHAHFFGIVIEDSTNGGVVGEHRFRS